jgi:2-polyprenyl-6-methoxyphenol hydroxylase-like FAD-dependent oxidoreductase
VAEEQVRRYLAVVGNAAHFLHPVAGQGFNLALRDVARLVEAVVAGWRRDLAPGELAVLEDYLSGQEGDQWQTILFSDSLPRTFATGGALPALRSIGLITLDLVPALRTEFARFGAGLAVRAARLPRFAGEGALP